MASRTKYTVTWVQMKGQTLSSSLGEIIINPEGQHITYDKTMFEFLSRFKDAKCSLETEEYSEGQPEAPKLEKPEEKTDESKIIAEELNKPIETVAVSVAPQPKKNKYVKE